MGKDFIPLKINGIDTKQAITKLFKLNKVIEASKEEFFNELPNKDLITEIEIGTENTTEAIFRFGEDYIVFNETLKESV